MNKQKESFDSLMEAKRCSNATSVEEYFNNFCELILNFAGIIDNFEVKEKLLTWSIIYPNGYVLNKGVPTIQEASILKDLETILEERISSGRAAAN